jgi:phage shock protein PspC (stress-responsive transcriptional regulator)
VQRVVSIHLNGNVYQIEETGYNALFAFLDSAETTLQNDSDRAQKLADLERLIAERCQASLGPHKAVVTSAEVERFLVELGHAAPSPSAEPAASNPTSNTTSTNPPPPNQSSPSQASPHPRAHRRLVQVREGAMISGVCVGLSEFLHIDVTIIRILFVVFALATSGWGMLVYGVLMFVVPKVDTRADASDGAATGTAPPHHWPWDDGWPWDKHGWPWDTHGWPWDQPRGTQPQPAASPQSAPSPQPGPAPSSPAADWREQRRQWRYQRRAARMAGGHHPFGTMMMILSLMMAFFWLSFWSRGHFFLGFPFFWGFPHWISIIVFFMMLRLIFMPFRAARYGYGAYGPYPHPQHAWISMWNGFAWFMVMIFAMWIAYRFIPEVHDLIRGWDSTLSLGGWNV